MDNDNSDISGKKIFFVHPSAIIQNEVAFDLIQQEYEVYLTREHMNLRRILRRYTDAIVFVNIDEGLTEKEWEVWIRTLQGDPVTASVGIGILTVLKNDELQRKYLDSVKIRCGYTVINKSDTSKSIVRLMEILRAADAHGRRKYLRATSEHEDMTTVNIPLNGQYYKGVIKDISVAGMSCSFAPDPELGKNSLCKDIQIKLHSMLLKGEGIIFGARLDGMLKVYVFLFTQRMDPDVRIKIRRYIQANMQEKMDAMLKAH